MAEASATTPAHTGRHRTEQRSGPAVELFVSGRLCLFGEHSDWAGGTFRTQNPSLLPGRTLVIGTQQGFHARAAALSEPVLTVCTAPSAGQPHLPPICLPLDPQHLLKVAQAGGLDSYVAGTAFRIATAHHVAGLDIQIHTATLPIGKGLSSSAAICVLVARAFNRVYGLQLTVRGEMEFAYQGEVTTPSKCGRMDQACAYGSIPVSMEFDGDLLHVTQLQLAAPLHLVVVDLRAAKDTTTILRTLQSAYPIAHTVEEQRLQELLGAVNHGIVDRAAAAMAQGDLCALGALMSEAQAEFDARAGPVCPGQLTAPVLHSLLLHPALQGLIWGGKGVGSQGDGTAQLLCKSAQAQQQVCVVVETMLGMLAMPLTVPATVQE